jgi:hypothetical protein
VASAPPPPRRSPLHCPPSTANSTARADKDIVDLGEHTSIPAGTPYDGYRDMVGARIHAFQVCRSSQS